MARQLRIQYKGAVYHITCRGNEKKNIFQDEKDKKYFLEFLEDSQEIYQVVLYCYVLMNNHYHLLIETPLGNLSEFMRRFNITYTAYFNRKNSRVGHLYQGRYKSILVEKESYLNMLSRYIHINPVKSEYFEKASLYEKEEYLKNYKWSSLLGYINENRKEKFIEYGFILDRFGGNNVMGREWYWQTIRDDLSQKMEIKDKIVGGVILGNERFILKIKEKYLSENHREITSIRRIKKYLSKNIIINAICKETGINRDELMNSKGTLRQLLMEALCEYAGMKGREIGELLGLDYSTVSIGRKRLKEKIKRDSALRDVLKKVEEKCQ